EVEVDAVYDGDNICIPGIFEHVERAGIHSGDSIDVYPPRSISGAMQHGIPDVTHRLASELCIRGLINVQYIVKNDELFVIEANPRASRTCPIIAKFTGIPLIAAAVAVALGKKLTDIGIPTGLLPPPNFVAVKAPVFSFSKLRRIETMLGPEMKSTGEVLGIDQTYAGALLRGLVGSGLALPPPGGRILLSIADEEKEAALPIARAFAEMDFELFATPGTWQYLRDHNIAAHRVNKIAEGSPHVVDLIADGGVDFVINNVAPNSVAQSDGVRIRRAALEGGVACLTSLDTVRALVLALEARVDRPIEVRS